MLIKMAKGEADTREIPMLEEISRSIEGHTICALGDAAAWPVQVRFDAICVPCSLGFSRPWGAFAFWPGLAAEIPVDVADTCTARTGDMYDLDDLYDLFPLQQYSS